jgi:hypothetical protein
MKHLAIALFALWGISTAFAATIHVPADQPTIQAGINAATNGDTVLVAPGTYTENLVLDAKSVFVVSGDGPGLTWFRWNGVGENAILLKNGANAEISGFSWTNQTPASSDYYILSTNSRLVLTHNRFDRLVLNGALVFAQTAGSARIERNVFSHIVHPNALVICHVPDTILNNTIDSVVRGIAIQVTHEFQVKNNIFSRASAYAYLATDEKEEFNCFWSNSVSIENGGSPDATDILSDPLFMNSDLSDYRLKVGSPCINSGDPNPNYCDPDGSRNDIGALPTGPPRQPRILLVQSPIASIQAAIDTSIDGDTVLIADGHYFERFTFSGKRILVASHYVLDHDSLHIQATIIDGHGIVGPGDTTAVVRFVNGEDTSSE